MRIKTKKVVAGYKVQLNVEKADLDGDVFVGSQAGCFYLHKTDVPRLIVALKWTAKG